MGGKPNNTSIHNSIGGISDNHKHLNMFEPPLIFRESKPQPPLEGNKSATVGNTENSFGSTSRRNSNTSQHFGYGLSRITSSSSSLNLNAYLTDDDDDNDINSALMPELNRSSSISTRYSLKVFNNNCNHHHHNNNNRINCKTSSIMKITTSQKKVIQP